MNRYVALALVTALAGVPAAVIAETALPPLNQSLPWPAEWPAAPGEQAARYDVAKSNTVLDLHGSPQRPDLVLFLAGNQYVLMPELLKAYREWLRTQTERFPGLAADNVFYATTPPGKLIDAMVAGRLLLGNFWLDVRPDALWPDVFMTGPRQQKRLRDLGHIDSYTLYARNRGVGLLVRAGNPRNIRKLDDLLRDDVRVVMSSRQREAASFDSYSAVLTQQGGAEFVTRLLAKPNTLAPAHVHHRENPQLIADDFADVAPMYRHFGQYLKSRLPSWFDFIDLPEAGNRGDELGIAKIKTAPRPKAAEAWLEFMRSPAAAAVYERSGFNFAGGEALTTAIVPK